MAIVRSMKIMAMTAALAAALTLGVTACSSGNSGSSEESGSDRQEVVMWGSWSGDQVDQINQQTAAFNQSQDKYEVSYVAQDDVEQKLLTAIAGGDVPDLVMWDRYQTALYAPKGAIQSIDDRVKADSVDLSVFYDDALGEMTSDNKVYGLPILVDVRSVVYNKTMFDKAGIQPPTTWDELKTAAEKLTVTNNGTLERSGFMLNDPGLFNVWLLQAVGQLLSDDGTKTAFNSPEGIEVLNFWKSLLDAGVYTNGFGDATDAFASSEAAMKYDGNWDIPTLDKVDGLQWGVADPIEGPNGDTGAIMGGFGLVIPTAAKNADGAWQFMKWWATQPENGVSFAKISSWLPANRQAANDSYFADNPEYSAFVKALDTATVRPTVPGYSDVEGKALTPALEQFMAGELTAEQALSQAQEQGDQILQENAQ